MQNRFASIDSPAMNDLFEEIDNDLIKDETMKLELKRIFRGDLYTIGHLYVDGIFYCDTLEDAHRPDVIKIPGETCIPEGTYKVIINDSIRFKRRMPLLLNVPGFEGIRIHTGNFATDTAGCILVGNNSAKGTVTNSKETFNNLFQLIDTAEGEVSIVIT